MATRALTPARTRLRDRYLPILRQQASRAIGTELREIRNLLEVLERGQDAQFMALMERHYRNRQAGIWTRAMLPVFAAYGELVAEYAAQEIGIEADAESATHYSRRYTERFADRQSAASRRQLTELIETETDPLQAVTDRLDDWEVRRADKVANWEANAFMNATAAFVFTGAGLYLVWRAAGAKPCEYCMRLDGQIVGREQPFLEAGQGLQGREGTLRPHTSVRYPPLHGGCMCFVTAG